MHQKKLELLYAMNELDLGIANSEDKKMQVAASFIISNQIVDKC